MFKEFLLFLVLATRLFDLQEMIQYADDARATVVQFFVDSRQHRTSGLVKKDKLKAYQSGSCSYFG